MLLKNIFVKVLSWFNDFSYRKAMYQCRIVNRELTYQQGMGFKFNGEDPTSLIYKGDAKKFTISGAINFELPEESRTPNKSLTIKVYRNEEVVIVSPIVLFIELKTKEQEIVYFNRNINKGYIHGETSLIKGDILKVSVISDYEEFEMTDLTLIVLEGDGDEIIY